MHCHTDNTRPGRTVARTALALAGFLAAGQAAAHGTEVTVFENTVIGPDLFAIGEVYYADETTNFTFRTNHTNASGVAWNGMSVTLLGWDWNANDYLPSPTGGPLAMLESLLDPFQVRLNNVIQTTGWTAQWSPTYDQVNFIFTGFGVNPGDVLHVRGMEVSNLDTINWRLHYEASAVTAVPLPAPLALLTGGIFSLLGVARRRRA